MTVIQFPRLGRPAPLFQLTPIEAAIVQGLQDLIDAGLGQIADRAAKTFLNLSPDHGALLRRSRAVLQIAAN